MTNAIEARGLVKIYRARRGSAEVRALDGVDLDVAQGTVLGLLGPNGAGKTTTVRILTTLLRPDGGSAKVAGYDVVSQSQEVRRAIGLSGQYAAVDENLTGWENLYMFGRLYEMPKAEAKKRAEDLLERFNLTDAGGRTIKTYSGGMRRRLDLAGALIGQPNLLFLDEPTTGLDPISRKKVWDEVRHLNEELGMTVFLTTQYLEEADELADRVGIISHGKLAVEDTPTALKRQLGNDLIVVEVEHAQMELAESTLAGLEGTEGVEMRGHELLVGTPNGAALLSPVAIALGKADLKVLSLTLRTPTLDDVFVSVTGERLAGDDDDQDDVESE